MVQRILKLAEGRVVPMEDGRAWPARGAIVEETLYIRRRLADGDLFAVEALDEDEPAEVPADDKTNGRKARNGDK